MYFQLEVTSINEKQLKVAEDQIVEGIVLAMTKIDIKIDKVKIKPYLHHNHSIG